MDLTRLRDEALRPAYAGQPVAYRAYSCREGAYLPPAQLPAQPLVILEGSYSHHPLLRPYETLRVFVTCTKAEQTRRLQAREGARYADFAARWVPLEEGLSLIHISPPCLWPSGASLHAEGRQKLSPRSGAHSQSSPPPG